MEGGVLMRVQLWRYLSCLGNSKDALCICFRIVPAGRGSAFECFDYDNGKLESRGVYYMCPDCSREYLKLINTQKRNGAPSLESQPKPPCQL